MTEGFVQKYCQDGRNAVAQVNYDCACARTSRGKVSFRQSFIGRLYLSIPSDFFKMTDYELQQRLAYLQKTLKKLKELRASTFDEFNSDFRVCDAALYNLEVATETAADLANRVITKRGGTHPRNWAETFRALCALGVIDKPLEMGLLKLALLKNTRAHSYVDVNLQELYILLRNGVPIITKVAKILVGELGTGAKG